MRADSSIAQKLVIGTAQFGFEYGVSNTLGITPPAEAASIIQSALKRGVFEVDAAPAYGDCEKVLGGILPDKIEIITKTGIAEKALIDGDTCEHFEETFRGSLAKLHRGSVLGLLVHAADDLLKPGGILLSRWLQDKKEEGLAKYIGVSIYSSGQLDKLGSVLQPDMVQLPFSILDQRLILSGHIRDLRRRGVRVYARSVFLQGLLLLNGDDLPKYFLPYREALLRFHEEALRVGVTPLTLALGYVASHPEIDKIVVGVNSAWQLEELLQAAAFELDVDEFSHLSATEEGLLNPSLWKV